MAYIPHTEVERQQMLAAIGVTTIEDLFDAVPATHRFPKLDLPDAMSEMEISREMSAMSEANEHAGDFALFRGAGAYHHFIPSVVNHVLLRGEFLTAYTPYQPEVSQGTLQSVFEYQSMMCALTGMDAANASHYDGATSLAEAVTMAYEVTRGKRKKVIFSHAKPRSLSAKNFLLHYKLARKTYLLNVLQVSFIHIIQLCPSYRKSFRG